MFNRWPGMAKYFVTGATGFLGLALVQRTLNEKDPAKRKLKPGAVIR